MIFRSVILASVIGLASANINPEVHIGVSAKDSQAYAGAFQPSVKWSTEGSVGDYDYEGGVNMRADDLTTRDVPFNIWGKLRREVGDWDLTAKADTRSDDLQHLDIRIDAEGGPADTRLRAEGSFDTSAQTGNLRNVGVSQSFDAPGGDIRLSPSLDLASGRGDVRLEYENKDTKITLDADQDHQKVTIAQRLDEDNQISPSITSEGDLEVEYRRNVGEGVMTAHYKPHESTRITYEEGPWQATADVPMDGFYNVKGGTKLSIRRSVSVEAS